MDWDLKNLNYNYGRTKQQIAKKGAILFEHTQNRGSSITEEECVEAVRYRVICQTWNGVIIREKNTILTLKGKFPELDFVSTSGDFDHKYAVDYEIKNRGNIICGIQIKPKSYLGNAPYLIKAQNANAKKNQQYKTEFGKPVFNVISKANGDIINSEVIGQLSNLK
ncbi:MAG: MjaI family restriction endonuclease [Gelidibacter sp.]